MIEFALGALAAPVIWYGLTFAALQRYRVTENSFFLWPAQISAFAILCVGAVSIVTSWHGDPLLFIFTLLCPPIVLFALVSSPFLFSIFFPVGVLTLVCASIPRKTRAWAVGLATLAMGLSVPFTADNYWDRKMCERAAHYGLTDIERAPFLYNLRRAGSKWGRTPYAIAFKGEEVWDWGYTRTDFVRYGGEIEDRADLAGLEPLSC